MFGEKEGYTAEFAMRHDQILQEILESPDQPVKVVVGCDDVCLKTSCPRYNEEKCCAAPELLAKDRRIAESFGVEIGATYPAQELMQRLNEMPEDRAPH